MTDGARDLTFLGVPGCDLSDVESYAGADVVILGAPFDSAPFDSAQSYGGVLDGGLLRRPGARFGPPAIRRACYLPPDGSRPSLALRVDPLQDLKVLDSGDVTMGGGEIDQSLAALEEAVYRVASTGVMSLILGGDQSVTLPGATALARELGYGRVSLISFGAHPGTADRQAGSLYGHRTPMRRLIESGAVRGERLLRFGLRGFWPDPATGEWMARQGIRSYGMTELTGRGMDDCLAEAFGLATEDSDGVYLSVNVDAVDPGSAPGTGAPEPGGLTARELLDAVRRCGRELPLVGMDVVEVSPPYDPAGITAYLGSRVVLEALSGLARRRRDARPS